MAWNIAVLCTEGPKETVENILPDIFEKAKEDLFFEDATSSSIGNGLAIGCKDGKIIIIDVLGRFIGNEKFPVLISQNNTESKVFYISESAVFRQYKNGAKPRDINGKSAMAAELRSLGMEISNIAGLFLSYIGFKGLLDKEAKLKIANNGLWTKKLGFVNWDDINFAEVVEDKSGKSPQLWLDIRLKGTKFEEANQPDERLLLSGLKDKETVEMVINNSITNYNNLKNQSSS
jgi:hypothetical protein